jgi:hypothetical protein
MKADSMTMYVICRQLCIASRSRSSSSYSFTDPAVELCHSIPLTGKSVPFSRLRLASTTSVRMAGKFMLVLGTSHPFYVGNDVGKVAIVNYQFFASPFLAGPGWLRTCGYDS